MTLKGIFREGLYWRLNVIPLFVPPLRERREDVPQLVANFIDLYNGRLGKMIRSFAPEAMDLLFSHHWPGNVRELGNAVERAMVLAKGDVITFGDLPPELRQQSSTAGSQGQVAVLIGSNATTSAPCSRNVSGISTGPRR